MIQNSIVDADVEAFENYAGLAHGVWRDSTLNSATIDVEENLLIGTVVASTDADLIGDEFSVPATSSFTLPAKNNVSYTPNDNGLTLSGTGQSATAAEFADFTSSGVTGLSHNINSAQSPYTQCAGMAFPVLKVDGFTCSNITLDYATAAANFPLSAGVVHIADDAFVDYSTSFSSIRRLELTSELPAGLFFNRITGTITGTITANNPGCSFNGFSLRAYGASENTDITVATPGFDLRASSTTTGDAAPTPYSGPVISGLGPNNSPSAFEVSPGESFRVTGLRLAGVTAVVVDGISVPVDSASSDQFMVTLPSDIEAGEYDITIKSSIGNLTYLNAL